MTRICIVQPPGRAVSETFVRAHVERLPGVVSVLHSHKMAPAGADADGSAAISRAVRTLVHGATRRLRREDPDSSWEAAIRRTGADVVLAEFGPTAVRVRAACERLNVPLVVHFHGYDAWVDKTVADLHDAYGELFSSAAAIVSGCRSMTTRLMELGAAPEKLVTNYVSTVSPEEFTQIDCGARPPLFVAVGRCVEKKGPHLTLLAFARMAHECPSAQLRMVGDGPLLGACTQLSKALGIADRVQFLGACDAATVRQELQASRCFVQHSVVAADGDREGTAISILEAAMTGLAVCATRHEGIAETMIDGDTALLVDECDVDAMSECMLSIATDTVLARRLGTSAASHVRRHFTMEKSIVRLSRLLDVVAAQASISTVQAVIEAEWADSRVADALPQANPGLEGK